MKHAYARAAAAYDEDDPEEFRQEYFKPGFVADSHAFRKILRSADTPPAALRLLVSIADHTTGYRLEWSAIRRNRLMDHADIKSRSTFQDAKSWLLKAGHIQTKWSRADGCTAYALGESLRLLLRPEEREARRTTTNRRRGLKAVPDTQGLRPTDHHVSAQSDPMLKTKENIDQQQATPAPPPPEQGDDALLGIVQELEQEWTSPGGDEAALSNEQHQQLADTAETGRRLVAQLIKQGVHERVAARLANTQPAEVIASAIARLSKVTTNNPAGYLVAEISRGGYQEPDRTKPLRVYHDEVHRLRQAERDRDADAKEQSTRKVASALDQFAQMPPEQQSEIHAQVDRQAHAEGFTRLFPDWGKSHTVYQGLLAELVAGRIATAWPGG